MYINLQKIEKQLARLSFKGFIVLITYMHRKSLTVGEQPRGKIRIIS